MYIIHNDVECFTFNRMKFQEPYFDSLSWTGGKNLIIMKIILIDFLFSNDNDMRLLSYTVYNAVMYTLQQY